MTLKQAYEKFVYDIFRSFSEEHKKYLVNKFLEMNKEWLTQKCQKPKYLTDEEMEMSTQDVNQQIALGVRSCKTIADVCSLLDDIRQHERRELLKEFETEAKQCQS